ncbi:hypothetical protein F5883DRAFT_541204 [Diaporthe sp. PMI_573]|nr:hypothetical protein F5883DRAFT_541204 [Diaporthaceae sp. PMI_573]
MRNCIRSRVLRIAAAAIVVLASLRCHCPMHDRGYLAGPGSPFQVFDVDRCSPHIRAHIRRAIGVGRCVGDSDQPLNHAVWGHTAALYGGLMPPLRTRCRGRPSPHLVCRAS